MTVGERIRDLRIDQIPGWMLFDELVWLYELARDGDVYPFVEIGSYQGRSTCAVLSGQLDAGRSADLVLCVDTFDGAATPAPMPCFAAFQHNIETRNLPMPMVIRAESVTAAARMRGVPWRAVFIDGAHDYASVRADIEAWAPLVASGGVICGHDYYEPGPRRAVDERFGARVRIATRSIWTVEVP